MKTFDFIDLERLFKLVDILKNGIKSDRSNEWVISYIELIIVETTEIREQIMEEIVGDSK